MTYYLEAYKIRILKLWALALFKPLLILVVLIERIIMLPRSRSFCFKNIKDSLFRSIIALEAWDYAKKFDSKKIEVRREVKMDKCPIVELGVLAAHLKKKEKKRKKNKKRG